LESDVLGSVGYKNDVRVGVVGCGAWGASHLRTWSALGCLEAAADLDPIKRDAVCTNYPGVECRASIEPLLIGNTIDAIVIATPAATHAELALQALEAGKDVLVEKPLALSVADAEKLAETAEERGRILMVDHVLEYHPAVVRLRQLLGDGTLGRIRYMYSHRLNLGLVRTEESALWSFAPHDLALLHGMVGDAPDTVACHGGAYLNPEVADVTLTTLSFPGSIRAHVFVSWLHPFKEHRFIVVGEREMAVFDDTEPWAEKLTRYPHLVEWVDGRVPIARRAEAIREPLVEIEPPRAACEHFLECIRTRRRPRTDAASGLAVIRVLDAADRSLAAGGVPIQLNPSVMASVFIHPTATVDPGAEVLAGTRIWHYSHVMGGARIGRDCVLGQNVFVASRVRIGNRVKIQNNVSVYEGVELEDDVFCGPSAVFTNVINPRAAIERKDEFRPTLVQQGATIGANATIVCGLTIGCHALVGAGAVVTRDVPDHALVIGVPARLEGFVCTCGDRLDFVDEKSTFVCGTCGRSYRRTSQDQVIEDSS